ncbi:MAG TPA: hypothetical protein VNM67_23765 [Thermoanaerobaculia bacterium]|nr:hypothetical protein [Thermoanaerobaculia bacterium]
MISGYVNARREALLSLVVRGPKGQEQMVEGHDLAIQVVPGGNVSIRPLFLS